MTNTAQLLNISNPLRQAKDKFDLQTTPTLLEAMVGFPSNIEGLTDEAQALKRFAVSLKEGIKSIGDTHFRIFSDHTLTDGAKLVRSANHAESKLNSARKLYEQIVEGSGNAATRIHQELKTALRPPTNAGEAVIDQELRAWANKQKPGTVADTARQNPELLAAIARAPAVLSGIDKKTHSTLQNERMKAVYPEEFAKAEELRLAFETVTTALGAMENMAKCLIDFETAKALDSRKVSVA